MECFYCGEEHLSIPSRGNCPHCHLHVCTAPSVRYDGNFHGEVCGCDCGVLVCERDLRKHVAQEHGRDDPEGCFPALWALISGISLGGSAAALVWANGDSINDVTRFVNMVAPRPALLDLLEVQDGWGELDRVHGSEEEYAVRLAEVFYAPRRLDRVFALAARELGRSARPLRTRADWPNWLDALTWIMRERRERWERLGRETWHRVVPDELLDSIWAFADYAVHGKVPPAHAIAVWLPQTADEEYFRNVLAENREVLSVTPEAVVEWIRAGATRTQTEAAETEEAGGEAGGAW